LCRNGFFEGVSSRPPPRAGNITDGRAEIARWRKGKVAVSALTIEGLKEILNEAAGDDDSFKPGQDILDIPFLELGFDSLALLETVALIKRKHGVAVADDEMAYIETPRQLLDKVNGQIAA
jgi:act minimal PKS acyl carrier protein